MERDMSFDRCETHLKLFHEKLRAATHDGVPGRWQPRPEACWDDAWLNLSQCIDMAGARAHHERLYEVEDTLIRFNCLLLRATAWRSELHAAEEMVHIRCGCPSWTRGSWRQYVERVKGYHCIHFEAALQDCTHLAKCLESDVMFRAESLWLRMIRTQLEVTKVCRQRTTAGEIFVSQPTSWICGSSSCGICMETTRRLRLTVCSSPCG